MSIVLKKINKLEQRYCDDCLLKQINRERMGKTRAHKFCISECTIGNKIKSYGNQLQ